MNTTLKVIGGVLGGAASVAAYYRKNPKTVTTIVEVDRVVEVVKEVEKEIEVIVERAPDYVINPSLIGLGFPDRLSNSGYRPGAGAVPVGATQLGSTWIQGDPLCISSEGKHVRFSDMANFTIDNTEFPDVRVSEGQVHGATHPLFDYMVVYLGENIDTGAFALVNGYVHNRIYYVTELLDPKVSNGLKDEDSLLRFKEYLLGPHNSSATSSDPISIHMGVRELLPPSHEDYDEWKDTFVWAYVDFELDELKHNLVRNYELVSPYTNWDVPGFHYGDSIVFDLGHENFGIPEGPGNTRMEPVLAEDFLKDVDMGDAPFNAYKDVKPSQYTSSFHSLTSQPPYAR